MTGDPLAAGPEPNPPLDSEREELVAEIMGRITAERLAEVAVSMVSIGSPTGQERPLAEWLATTLAEAGTAAQVVPMDPDQASATATITGDGTGADLLWYAPIDTLTIGDERDDLPWIGDQLRSDMRPVGRRDGDLVIGLGASNPKGHAACIVVAMEAVAARRAAGHGPITWQGSLRAGFGAGGMPTNSPGRTPALASGQGAGCAFLLQQGLSADACVIAKPGWQVSWEEVGLCWFDVWVRGTHTYVGSRHLLPYRNAVADAGRLAMWLEEWFPTYTKRHTDGLVAPQGIVAAVEGGWMRMASVTPAQVRLRVDLRLSPRTSPQDARREFDEAIRRAARDLSIDVRTEMVLAIPALLTDPQSWVARSAAGAWETVTGRRHQPMLRASGATDANILRQWGLPTVRVGMPKVTLGGEPLDFQAGMNTVDIADMRRLCEVLIRVAVDTCTRPKPETVG